MKPQTLFVLVSLIGMLLTPHQVEGVLGDKAVQANGNIAFTSQSNLIRFPNLTVVIKAVFKNMIFSLSKATITFLHKYFNEIFQYDAEKIFLNIAK